LFGKRSFDLVILVLGAIVWVPVLLVASAAVLVLSGRPIYYKSMRRISQDKIIPVVKFRAMVRNAEKLANRETVPVENNTRFLNIPPSSPLYTPVGRWIERLGLTELPQLLLVAQGKMTLVGNRPLPENVMNCLREEYTHADDRFLVRAGLTGPAQLVGRQALTDDERLTLEAAYCNAARYHYRYALDFKIVLFTVMIVAHLKQPLSYLEVLDLLNKGVKVPVLASASATVAELLPTQRASQVVASEAVSS